jgi:putative transposase
VISPARRRETVEHVRPCWAYRSGAPAGSWGNHELRNGMLHKSRMMKRNSQPGLWPWPVSMDGGYRRITVLLRREGWQVNHKRVERIWRQEGLKVPARQPKRGRLWLNDGSCVRLRPEYPNYVWSYDFMQDRTHDGRAFRVLNVID